MNNNSKIYFRGFSRGKSFQLPQHLMDIATRQAVERFTKKLVDKEFIATAIHIDDMIDHSDHAVDAFRYAMESFFYPPNYVTKFGGPKRQIVRWFGKRSEFQHQLGIEKFFGYIFRGRFYIFRTEKVGPKPIKWDTHYACKFIDDGRVPASQAMKAIQRVGRLLAKAPVWMEPKGVRKAQEYINNLFNFIINKK